MRIVLDPTQLHENGKTAVFVPLVSGGPGDGYWNVGIGARWRFTTNATKARVRVYATADPNPYGLRAYPNAIPYRVNGSDRWAGWSDIGDGWYDLIFPTGFSKTVELFVPVTNALVFGQTPVGVYPVEIEFNTTATVVAPVTTGAHRVIYGNSITTGINAFSAVLQGFAGIMKRGTSDAFLPATSVASQPRWKGAYSAGTLYAINDVVSNGGFTWRKLTTAAAGTATAVGSDWNLRGFVGRVTAVAHGSRRLFDDCSTSGAQTAFATTINALGPTELIMMIGTNDWATGFASAAAFQAAYLGFLNALPGTYPVRCVSPLLTAGASSREGAGLHGFTLDDLRTAVANAAAATTRTNVTHITGKTILTSSDLDDGLHPTTAGHVKLRTALL